MLTGSPFKSHLGQWVAYAENSRVGAYCSGPTEDDVIREAREVAYYADGFGSHVGELPSKVRAGSDVTNGRVRACAYRVGRVR